MKISSFRRYYVYYWYSQFIFVFCPRKWKCSTWWAGQWTHLEPRGSPQRNEETHVCIVCTSWYREVSDGARPRPCLPTGRSWALCLGHSCQNRMCPQLAPGSWEEQRGCTGVGVAFAPAMEFIGRWKCRSSYFEAGPPSVVLREAEKMSGGISLFHMVVPCKYSTVNKDLPGN